MICYYVYNYIYKFSDAMLTHFLNAHVIHALVKSVVHETEYICRGQHMYVCM